MQLYLEVYVQIVDVANLVCPLFLFLTETLC